MAFESAKTHFALDLLKKVIRYPFLVSARCAAARDPAISVVSFKRSDLCPAG
jgi:hypothetical protein